MIEDNAVVYEIVFPSPPERLWQALVDPRELAAWLMPAPGFAPVTGQRFTMACDPFGEISGEVIEVIPHARLSMRWTGSFGDTVVTFQLEPERSGTRLRLTHGGWDEAHAAFRDQFRGGWHTKIGEGLSALLSAAA